MINVVAVAAGGALGALLRFWVYGGVHHLLGRGFPYGTLTVNVLGSLAMGFLYVWLFDRLPAELEAHWRAFLMVGCLGAFTTFSAFSIETLNLLEQGAYLKSGLNVLLSVVVCVGAAFLGVLAARQLH